MSPSAAPAADAPARTESPLGPVHRLLRVFVNVKATEIAAVGWAWLYFFCVLSSYYVIRPIRDELGVASGVENLSWLFTGTLVGMVLFNPPFAALASRLPRRRFIGYTYRFFLFNLIGFLVAMRVVPDDGQIWVGRAFFVWVSVFNMFVVSIFWATLVDLFTREQGQRLFGFIAAGATIGAIFGSALTGTLVSWMGASNLLMVSALLLELSVQSFKRLARAATVGEATDRALQQEHPVGGSAWAGITQVMKSPYLIGICAYMLLFTTTTTFLYFQQANIVDAAITDRTARTEFFAQLNLAINVIALFVQTMLTGRIVRWCGVAVTLTILPALSIVGFILVGLAPTIAIIVGFQVLRRAGEFALARPAREILFTTVSREEKYKAKSLIDTFVYRLGDQVGAWSYSLMTLVGLGVAGVAWAAVPLSLIWMANGWWLGRRQDRMEREDSGARAA